MINESGLIAVEHAVKAQGEEFTRVALLNVLFTFLLIERVIHIEQVAEAVVIVVAAAHISLFFGQNFSAILSDKSTHLNVLKRNYPPHNVVFLFYSCDAHSVVFLVLGRHQVVLADVLVAATRGVTFTKLEHLV